MALKDGFTADEWEMLVGAPHAVGTAVMLASFSGLGGTAQEAFSLGKALALGATSSNELLKEICVVGEGTAAQGALRERVKQLDPQNLKAELPNMAMGEAKQAVDALKEKSPENVEPYKEWLMRLAFDVANASKEGDFLGIGGKRISDEERDVLNTLSEVLGMPVPSSATP
jgi:hypothetical protein